MFTRQRPAHRCRPPSQWGDSRCVAGATCYTGCARSAPIWAGGREAFMSSPTRCAGVLAAGGLFLASLAASAAAPSSSASRPVPRVYPVADLIVPINQLGGKKQPEQTTEQQLIRLIQSSVCPH